MLLPGKFYTLINNNAIDYFEAGLAIRIKEEGTASPEVALLWNNLGLALNNKGEYDKAIYYYDKALASYLKTFGSAHPDTLKIRGNLEATKQALADNKP